MIQRYPHTAIITIETLSGGPMPTVTKDDITIPGRYEPAPARANLNYSAKYYCALQEALKEDPNAYNGKKLKFQGRSIGISRAHNYQTHCEIWLD